MDKQFSINHTYSQPVDFKMVDLVHWLKYQDRNRRKRAKWLYQKFPMFAVAMMQEKYPGYTYTELMADITRPTKKGKSFRRKKTPMFRCGRYQEMQRFIRRWEDYKNPDDLAKAQMLRKRMWLPWIVQKTFGKKQATFQFPYTIGINIVKEFSKLLDDCQSIDEAEKLYDDFYAKNISIASINDSK
jgi:hypothetical protein